MPQLSRQLGQCLCWEVYNRVKTQLCFRDGDGADCIGPVCVERDAFEGCPLAVSNSARHCFTSGFGDRAGALAVRRVAGVIWPAVVCFVSCFAAVCFC